MFSTRGRSSLLLLLPIIAAWAWVSWCGYRGLNGQDAHDYLRIARAWTAWTHGGPRPHLFEHPHGYPIMGALLGVLVGSEGLALRLISAASLVVIVLTFRGVLRRAFLELHRYIDAFVLLTLVLSPFLLRHALVVMSDVPAMGLLALTYACTLRWIATPRWTWLCGALLTAGLAVSVRFGAAPIALLLLIALVHGPAQGRRLRWSVAITALVVGGIVLFSVLPMDQLRMVLQRSPVGDWSALDLFRRELRSDDGVLRYAVPNIVYVCGIAVHPGFLPIGVLLLPFMRREDLRAPHARLAFVLVVSYLLFIAGMPFQNDRVLLLAQPFMAVLLFPAFTRAWERLKGWDIRPVWAIAALVVMQSALFVRAMVPFIRQARTERELAARMEALHAPHIYTHGMGAAFSDLCPNTQVTELWYGVVDRFEPGALIVVQPANLATQWEGRPPAINWERAQVQGIEAIEQRPDGWTIARVR